jgi:cation diffusion facilitator CzcD-associated flavoprotein CzcO
MLTLVLLDFHQPGLLMLLLRRYRKLFAFLSPVTCRLHHQIANWLEFYADALDLNVWTSSTVTSATPDASNTSWTVAVKRGDGTERVFRHVKYVVFATGL